MAPKINDPNQFLQALVSRKGRSDLFGVHLSSVSVLANAEEDYDYDVSEDGVWRELENTLYRDRHDWNQLLVDIRQDHEQVVFPISFLRGREPYTVFFAIEDTEMSCMVFIPSLVSSEFPSEVVFFQKLLQHVATFAQKTPTTIRFTIGCVTMEWDEIIGRGEAREVTITL